jgi:hypothetical protein
VHLCAYLRDHCYIHSLKTHHRSSPTHSSRLPGKICQRR